MLLLLDEIPAQHRSIGSGGFEMTTGEREIALAIEIRRRRQQHSTSAESVEERFVRFIQLQTASFDLLRKSPEGFQNLLRRNHKSRRVEVVDGVWQPVSAERCMKAATGRAKDQLDLENLPGGE